MRQSNSATGGLEAIRRELDELATRALTSSAQDPAEMLAALGKIAEQAAAGGVEPAAGLASQLARTLREQPPAGYEETLQAIATLETALEEVGHTEQVDPGVHAGHEIRFDPASGRRTASRPLPISADPELLREFVAESRDHLAAIETSLLAIEQDPQNTEAIHAVFRGFHTMKGLAGFLELPAMQGVAHEIETLLDHARNGRLQLSPALIDVALEGADFIRTDVDRVAAELAGGAASAPLANEQLIAKVRCAVGVTKAKGAAEAAQTTAPENALRVTLENSEVENSQWENPRGEGSRVESARGESLRMVRVATGKLDFLVDMVGELVIAQSMIHHDPELSSLPSAALQRNLAQLGRITAEVQKTAMSMRMVPVGQLFQKSARLVRDLTRRQGKLAELEISGEETQLDRTIIEELADPLLHMIRNSADHGLETPAERTAAGKPAHGRIGLKAYHRAGHIAIEVSDDGRGLQREKILAKARERGLVALAAELTDKEVFNLIFEPGFSTADRVTEISGRGVGMDVVRKQVQKLRGRVEIESQPGRGSTFILKLPLTLAIIDGLVVGVGPERYILPIYAVEEMFRPLAETVFTVENRREMVLIRGNLLPVVRLGRRFGVKARASALADSVLVVAESGETRFCLAVDELLGKQEVVIKNLGELFRDVPGVAGGAILGDGRVGLILDMEGVFRGGANGDGAHA